MRYSLLVAAIAAGHGVAAACSSKSECLARLGSSGTVGAVAASFAAPVLDAHDWAHHGILRQTIDSQWCPNNT
jgi:hypothetical protein